MKTGLAFSGGKDSWACLWLYKEKLKDITVIWVNTGKNYPEILETVELAKLICPNFVTVHVDRDGQNEFNGLPSDVVPVDWTREGQACTSEKEVKIQSYLSCCYDNIAKSLISYCNAHGITELINGQRKDEGHKSTSKNGDVVLGIKRIQPLDNWSEKEVFEFLQRRMGMPAHFSFKHTSMDCYDCTAYVKDTKDIRDHRKIHWPHLDEHYRKRKSLLDSAITQALKE